jgi:hypothetical protein
VHSGAYELTVEGEGIATVHWGWFCACAKLIETPADGNGQAEAEAVFEIVLVTRVDGAVEVNVGLSP